VRAAERQIGIGAAEDDDREPALLPVALDRSPCHAPVGSITQTRPPSRRMFSTTPLAA
jgi:hypothetical protein